MAPVCDTCNDTTLIATTKAFRFGLRLLDNLVKREREYLCPSCGQRTTDDPFASDTPMERTGNGNTRTGDVRRRHVMLDNRSADALVHNSRSRSIIALHPEIRGPA